MKVIKLILMFNSAKLFGMKKIKRMNPNGRILFTNICKDIFQLANHLRKTIHFQCLPYQLEFPSLFPPVFERSKHRIWQFALRMMLQTPLQLA